MFDLHIHSKNSHDSKQTLDEICASAIKKGLSGIAVCDHVDMWFYHDLGTYDCIKNCMEEVRAAQEKYHGKLEIFQGVEMAEYLYDAENAEKIMQLCDYDVILGSVHSVKYADFPDSYSRVDFGEMAQQKIYGFLGEYFSKITEMIEKTEIDVLSHLTCPLRYINGKYDRDIDVLLFEEQIRTIFRLIMEKKIALEVNTSGIGTNFGEYMPSLPLLRMYREMGGTMLTIGSDAHIPERVGKDILQTKTMLKNLGFSSYCVFRKREAQYIVL